MKKVYKLVIVFDTDTEEIDFLDENVNTERPSFTIGDVDVADICDDEILDLINESYVLAEA